MGEMWTELTRLKNQMAAGDAAAETVMALRRQAAQLHQIPATKRTLQSTEVVTLYTPDCGGLRMGRQPHRGTYRDHKTVTCIACRALMSAVQTHLTSCPALNEEAFPFLTKLLDVPSNSQRTIPRTVVALHLRLNEAETLPIVPFGHHDSDEELFGSSAWYSMAMLAALEVPDVPFHTLVCTCTTSALQDIISRSRAHCRQAALEQRPSIPTVSEVCEVLQSFYQDPYAQHLQQDWVVRALRIPEGHRQDMEHIAELFNTATEDFLALPRTRNHRHAFVETHSCDMHFVSVADRVAEAYIVGCFSLRPDATTACQFQRRVSQTVHVSRCLRR